MQSRAKSQRRKEGAKGNYKAAIPELSAAVKPIGLCVMLLPVLFQHHPTIAYPTDNARNDSPSTYNLYAMQKKYIK